MFLSGCLCIVFEHWVILIAEFKMEGKFTPEKGTVAEGARLVIHKLGEKLILVDARSGRPLYLLHHKIVCKLSYLSEDGKEVEEMNERRSAA